MLMRFDPFRELDRLTQQAARGAQPTPMPMDAYRDGDRFVVEFDLPGVDPGSIDLTVEKNVLTVQAERRPKVHDGQDVVVSERPAGLFTRQLFLGDSLDPDKVQADYDRGVLRLTIPVAEQAKPRRVEVTSSGQGDQAIETPSTAAETGSSPPAG